MQEAIEKYGLTLTMLGANGVNFLSTSHATVSSLSFSSPINLPVNCEANNKTKVQHVKTELHNTAVNSN